MLKNIALIRGWAFFWIFWSADRITIYRALRATQKITLSHDTMSWLYTKISCMGWTKDLSEPDLARRSYPPLLYIIIKLKFVFLVSLLCGQTSSENCTFLTLSAASTTTVPTNCVYTLCKNNPSICRIRLDFMVRPFSYIQYQSYNNGLEIF